MSARPERAVGPTSLIIPAICALLFLVQVAVFRWGVITPDTVAQYGQALSGQYEDWHPPVTAWIWRQLLHVQTGSAPFLMLDCALYWTGLGLVAEAFRRERKPVAAACVIAVALLPIPFGEMGAILKDSLLAGCCILASGLLAFAQLRDRPLGWTATLGCCVLLIVAAASRFNAVLAAAPLLALCLAPGQWQGSFRRGGTAIAIAATILAGTTILVNQLLLQPRRTYPIFSLVNFDLAGTTVWSGRSVYPAGAAPPHPLIARCYTPAMFNPRYETDCDRVEDALRDYSHTGGTGALRLWADAVRAAPWAYVRHRALHFNAGQRWWVPRVPDDAVYVMSADNRLGLHFVANPAAMAVYRAATAMAVTPLGRPATWLAVSLGILILAARDRASPLARALALSSLCYGLGYAFVGVAPDLRYNLWTMIAAMLGAVILGVEFEWRDVSRGRLAVAALPLAIALSGELLGLAGGG